MSEPSQAQTTALYGIELIITAIFLLLGLAVGFLASWWGTLGMFVAFLLGSCFRFAQDMRLGRYKP